MVLNLGHQLVHFDDKDISTEYSSLMSKVVSNGNERIKFPINEPAQGRRKSQIDEYLEFYRGPGVQHMALATNDVIHTVTELRDRGVDFLHVPTTYYDDLQQRVGRIDEPLDQLNGTINNPENIATLDFTYTFGNWRVRYGVDWIDSMDSYAFLEEDL